MKSHLDDFMCISITLMMQHFFPYEIDSSVEKNTKDNDRKERNICDFVK